jgi:hypothetical protein
VLSSSILCGFGVCLLLSAHPITANNPTNATRMFFIILFVFSYRAKVINLYQIKKLFKKKDANGVFQEGRGKD